MIDRSGIDNGEDVQRVPSDMFDLTTDHNGNEQFDIDQSKYLRMLHESTPDPDSLSIISDYSVMGQEIKQSIRFSDMIMSTYSDLKNPSKSITVIPNHKSDPDMMFRKYNMLSLAMEFSKWKESSVDLSIGECQSDCESRCTKDESANDSTMASCSASIKSDFSCDHRDFKTDINQEWCHRDVYERSPLQVHIDQKFQEAFSGNKSSSDSETGDERLQPRLKISRPAWAQSVFHRDTLMKMPKTIREATSLIRHFDFSKEKYLRMLTISQLQLILNGLMTQIEELNESLVATLISRDELRSEQTSMVIQVEEGTIKARNVAQKMRIREQNSAQSSLNPSQSYGIVHRFLSNLKCSQRFASSRVISFFSPNNVCDVPPPEYV